MSGNKKYLQLMNYHCGKIISKVAGKTADDWVSDENLSDAVCMRLMALAECTKEYLKRNPEILTDYPEIPWKEIVRFRDKIAHHYERIDLAVIRDIVETDIFSLQQVICDVSDQSDDAAPSP